MWRRAVVWLLLSLPTCAKQEYLTYVDPTARHGLRRVVGNPDGSLMKLHLENRASVVRAFSVDIDGSPLEEMDVSTPDLQKVLVSSEREAHGIHYWQPLDEAALAEKHALWRAGRISFSECAVPEDIHLEKTAGQLYDAIFSDVSVTNYHKTKRLVQVGDLSASSEDDVARSLIRSKGLLGVAIAGSLPKANPEAQWTQGPVLDGRYEASVEGGALVFNGLQDEWKSVDVVRLDQNLPGGCFLLKGLLAAGLQTAMIVMFLNSQFPPPLRFASLGQQSNVLPVALFGCSLSFAIDILQPYGFHLVRLSGPYSAFIHHSKLLPKIGPRLVDEFACYRDSQVWGFAGSFPIEYVREWFFRQSGENIREIWQRCQSNVSASMKIGITNPSRNERGTHEFVLFF